MLKQFQKIEKYAIIRKSTGEGIMIPVFSSSEEAFYSWSIEIITIEREYIQAAVEIRRGSRRVK